MSTTRLGSLVCTYCYLAVIRKSTVNFRRRDSESVIRRSRIHVRLSNNTQAAFVNFGGNLKLNEMDLRQMPLVFRATIRKVTANTRWRGNNQP